MIRHAHIEDAFRIAEIQIGCWRTAYNGLIPDAYLQGLDVDKRERTWRGFVGDASSPVLVSQIDKEITGFCHIAPSRDRDASATAEIIAIYVDPRHWGKGFGRNLFASALSFARQQQFHHLSLWTLAGNDPARGFYESLGFQLDGATKCERTPAFTLDQVRYRLPVKPSDEAGQGGSPRVI